jgi:hypothetical protein
MQNCNSFNSLSINFLNFKRASTVLPVAKDDTRLIQAKAKYFFAFQKTRLTVLPKMMQDSFIQARFLRFSKNPAREKEPNRQTSAGECTYCTYCTVFQWQPPRQPAQSHTQRDNNVCETFIQNKELRCGEIACRVSQNMVRHTLGQSSNTHPTDAEDGRPRPTAEMQQPRKQGIERNTGTIRPKLMGGEV